jgi:hypothetical protein
MDNLKAALKSNFSRQEIGESFLPANITEHVAATTKGHNLFAKLLAKDMSVSLPNGGTSKSAKSKAISSTGKLGSGLVSLLERTPLRPMFRCNLAPQEAAESTLMEPPNPAHRQPQASLLPQARTPIESI